MVETHPSPENIDLTHFNALLPLAQANPYGVDIWFDITGRKKANKECTVWQLSHVTEADRTQVPLPFLDHHFHYLTWSTGDPEVRSLTLLRGPNASLKPTVSGAAPRPLTVPRLCSTFMRVAAHPDTLSAYTEAYVDWCRDNTDIHPGDTYHVLANLIISSLLLEENPLLNEDSKPMQALAQLRPQDANFLDVTQAASRIMGTMLLGRMPKRVIPSRQLELVLERRQEVLRVADLLDRTGILNERFWLEYGVHAGAVFSVPGMLELTHTNLQREREFAALSAREVSSVESTLRLYVDNLLRNYSTDPARHQPALRAIQTATTNDRGSAGLGKIIAFANGVTTVLNNELAAAGRHANELLPRLEPTDLSHLGEAIIRILRRFELPGLPPEIRRQHLEQDALHASIIEILRTGLRDRSAVPNLADIRLRYPDATLEEATEMMGGLRKGASPAQVDSWFRARKKTSGLASGWHAQRPGYGAIS
ncbi:MAG TPA: hypothetical protein VJ836_01180 [Candidatus Saccharimonadales bacterium]|nr:hypothetical protein [Candidatus Saccharimonadales bacterium]